MTAKASRVQLLPLVVAISSLLFQRVAPRTDLKFARDAQDEHCPFFWRDRQAREIFATHTRASRDARRALSTALRWVVARIAVCPPDGQVDFLFVQRFSAGENVLASARWPASVSGPGTIAALGS